MNISKPISSHSQFKLIFLASDMLSEPNLLKMYYIMWNLLGSSLSQEFHEDSDCGVWLLVNSHSCCLIRSPWNKGSIILVYFRSCWIWGSHHGDCEEHNFWVVMQYSVVKVHWYFWGIYHLQHSVNCLLIAGFLLGWLSEPKDGHNVFFWNLSRRLPNYKSLEHKRSFSISDLITFINMVCF